MIFNDTKNPPTVEPMGSVDRTAFETALLGAEKLKQSASAPFMLTRGINTAPDIYIAGDDVIIEAHADLSLSKGNKYYRPFSYYEAATGGGGLVRPNEFQKNGIEAMRMSEAAISLYVKGKLYLTDIEYRNTLELFKWAKLPKNDEKYYRSAALVMINRGGDFRVINAKNVYVEYYKEDYAGNDEYGTFEIIMRQRIDVVKEIEVDGVDSSLLDKISNVAATADKITKTATKVVKTTAAAAQAGATIYTAATGEQTALTKAINQYSDVAKKAADGVNNISSGNFEGAFDNVKDAANTGMDPEKKRRMERQKEWNLTYEEDIHSMEGTDYIPTDPGDPPADINSEEYQEWKEAKDAFDKYNKASKEEKYNIIKQNILKELETDPTLSPEDVEAIQKELSKGKYGNLDLTSFVKTLDNMTNTIRLQKNNTNANSNVNLEK